MRLGVASRPGFFLSLRALNGNIPPLRLNAKLENKVDNWSCLVSIRKKVHLVDIDVGAIIAHGFLLVFYGDKYCTGGVP